MDARNCVEKLLDPDRDTTSGTNLVGTLKIRAGGWSTYRIKKSYDYSHVCTL